MNEKVTRAPIIALIAVSCIGLLAFSVLQFKEKRETQEKAVHQLAVEHEQTTAVMNRIGQDSLTEAEQRNEVAQREYDRSPQAIELKRLEADDRAALQRPPSSTPRRSTDR